MWIDRRIADLEAWKKKRETVREHAVELYELLWNEIVEHLNQAQEKGFLVSTGGAPRKRIVRLQKHQKAAQCFELEIALLDEKDRIRVEGDRVRLFLDLDVCPDGVVCLELDEERISIEAAAIRILDPFVFPQLQK